VARLERQVAAEGVLEGSQMAGTFDLLRANDLIFNYVVSSWLMGTASGPTARWPGAPPSSSSQTSTLATPPTRLYSVART
jgi:hypothetical protein